MSEYGIQNVETKSGRGAMLCRIAILLAIITLSTACGTQYIARQYGNHEALGWHVNGFYPPYKVIYWWHVWGSERAGDNTIGAGLSISVVVCAVGFLAFLILDNMRKNRMKKESDLHGTARWAKFDDICKAALIPHKNAKDKNGKRIVESEGVYVGGWRNQKKKLVYLRHDGPEHVLCYAPTRSGKGVGLVNPTLLTWPHSAVITDIKGELWELTAGWRHSKECGNKVIRFEPASSNSAKWNVFDSIRFETEYETRDIGNVAGLIVDPDGKGLEDHWAKTSYALLVGCIAHVYYKKKKEGKTACLADVDSLLSDPTRPLADVWKEMATFEHLPARKDEDGNDLPRTHEDAAKAGADMMNRAEGEAGSVLSTTKSFLSLYRDPIIRKNTSRSDFTIDQIANSETPVSVYIVTKPADLTRIRPIFRLFITMVIGCLADELDVKDGRMMQKNKHRTLLMLDEFPSLGKLDIMQRALAFIAGYGLKAYLITQDLSQLYAAYGKEESITSNCHVQIAYPPNRQDTAQYISRMTGATTAMKQQINVSGKRTEIFNNNVSYSMTEQARNLLTEDQVLRLPAPVKDSKGNIVTPGHMLIFCAGLPAIYGQQILYFQDKFFLNRAKIRAPQVSDSLADQIPGHAKVKTENTDKTKVETAKPKPEGEQRTANSKAKEQAQEPKEIDIKLAAFSMKAAEEKKGGTWTEPKTEPKAEDKSQGDDESELEYM